MGLHPHAKSRLWLALAALYVAVISIVSILYLRGWNSIREETPGQETTRRQTEAARGQTEAARDRAEIARGQTVLLGTWVWDVDTNRFPNEELRGDGDVWWEQVTRTERYLVPLNGARLASLRNRAFEQIAADELANTPFASEKISGSVLTPGAVVAVHTTKGNFAKLQVVRYRALHDFSFKEAEHLTPQWREFARRGPNIDRYHLEVRWVLYER